MARLTEKNKRTENRASYFIGFEVEAKLSNELFLLLVIDLNFSGLPSFFCDFFRKEYFFFEKN
jgi:hypothetical protein